MLCRVLFINKKDRCNLFLFPSRERVEYNFYILKDNEIAIVHIWDEMINYVISRL